MNPARFGFFAALCGSAFCIAAPAAERAAPRLVVIIALDQGRADYLERFAPWLGRDGFQRLIREGTSFPAARYRHSITQTAVGHAQMSTGAFSERHGIIGNDWLDRSRWQTVNCVEDEASQDER